MTFSRLAWSSTIERTNKGDTIKSKAYRYPVENQWGGLTEAQPVGGLLLSPGPSIVSPQLGLQVKEQIAAGGDDIIKHLSG